MESNFAGPNELFLAKLLLVKQRRKTKERLFAFVSLVCSKHVYLKKKKNHVKAIMLQSKIMTCIMISENLHERF